MGTHNNDPACLLGCPVHSAVRVFLRLPPVEHHPLRLWFSGFLLSAGAAGRFAGKGSSVRHSTIWIVSALPAGSRFLYDGSAGPLLPVCVAVRANTSRRGIAGRRGIRMAGAGCDSWISGWHGPPGGVAGPISGAAVSGVAEAEPEIVCVGLARSLGYGSWGCGLGHCVVQPATLCRTAIIVDLRAEDRHAKTPMGDWNNGPVAPHDPSDVSPGRRAVGLGGMAENVERYPSPQTDRLRDVDWHDCSSPNPPIGRLISMGVQYAELGGDQWVATASGASDCANEADPDGGRASGLYGGLHPRG